MGECLNFMKLIFRGIFLICLMGCKTKIEAPEPYIFEYPTYFGKPHLPEDNPLTKQGVKLGRELFFSTLLSSNEKISCASCHRPEYNFADNQQYSEGIDGNKTVFNVPHLINLAWNPGPFGWSGRAKTVRQAIRNAILSTTEMNGNFNKILLKINDNEKLKKMFYEAFPYTTSPVHSENVLKALEQYVLSLVSCNSKYDLWKQGLYEPTESEKRGFELFFKSPKPREQRGAGCGDCHSGHLTSNGRFINNGLFPIENGYMETTQNPFDKGKFKVPSLRNVALSAPYMHNGQFKTLEEVINHYDSEVYVSEYTDPILLHQQNELGFAPQLNLTEQEKKDLISFLNMLTDYQIKNK